ncbi:hypothetical protein [Pelomicrobium methylotrophicum]|uniref:Uncharacterized protein n=1 Tax=Pelomicrobium methylotrophicum TaxID=2602750 RepID=A0A5C7EGE5_9PROT|nr:hypothetical protein [Pelomicrobium methylotrophicum]TXF10355.1 hypothetical protein FR698_15645 [Pelomicrobium methylotrophicum]
MLFIALKHIKAQRANLQQTNYLAAATPVFASVMLGHAIAARLGSKDLGVGIIHHAAHPHVERMPNKGGFLQGEPVLYRGATGDIASGGGGPMENAVQPAVTGDLDVSLIIAVDGVPSMERVEEVITEMRLRLAGGIVPALPRVEIKAGLDEAIRSCGRGFWIHDATGTVKARLGDGMDIIDAIMTPDPTGWYVPATLGYRALTRFRKRAGARDDLDHAYGEPLVGLVRYQSVKSPDFEPLGLWKHQWIGDSTFVVTQGD